MLYKNWLFLAAGFVSVCIFAHPSVAVPTVRKLGVSANNNVQSNIQNGRISQTKSSTAGNRAPSVRLLGSSAKTTSKAINNAKSIKATSTTTNSTDSSRLSGLHGNLVKGIGTKIAQGYTPSTSGIGTSELEQRVNALEEEMIIKSGDGLIIDGNKIILSEEIKDLPEQVAEINQKVEELNEKFDSANYATESYVQEIVSQLTNAKIVNHFDSGFLTGNQGQ